MKPGDILASPRKTLGLLVSFLLAFELFLPAPVFAETCQDSLQTGLQLFKAEKFDEAIPAFTRAAEAQDVETAKLACAYAGLCHYRKGDLDQTIAWFERALGKDANYLPVLENLTGVCFGRRSTYSKGMQVAQRAEALYSREPGVYYNMACYHALSGNADHALRYIDKALYYGYSDLAHLASDADFASVRDIEPFKRFFIHLDSVGAADDLRDQGAKKSAASNYDEALQLYENSLDHYQDALGADSLAGTAVLLALGSVSSTMGQFDAAIGYDEKALAKQAELLGEEHPDVATCYSNLGLLHYYKGEYERAIGYYQKALAIQLKALGEGHANVAASYNNLGGAYYSKGENDRAIEYYGKALVIWTNALGAEHPRVAVGYYNLGNAYNSKSDYDKAIECYEKALAIQLKALGAEHPDVAQSYNSLGVAYQNKGEYDRAIDYHQKALAIRLKVFGDGHPDVAESYMNLGADAYFEGNYDGTIGYYEKALAIRLKVLGEGHPDTAQSYLGLGGAYYSKGEYDEAVEYYEKALAIQLKMLGEEHPDIARNYISLGEAYRSKGEYDRAIGYFEKALAIQLKIFGEGHPDVAHSYDNLGGAYDSKGEYDQAIAYYEKALAIRLKALGEGHLDVAQSYVSLASAYYSKGDYDRAVDYDEKAVAIQLKKVGEEHSLVAQSYNNLGLALAGKGERDTAVGYYEKALSIQLKVLGAEHPNVALSYENLGAVWYLKGDFQRAIEYGEKALRLAGKSADRQLFLQSAKNLGFMDLQLKHYPEAKKAFLEGVAEIEQARGETGGGKAEFMARNISLYYLSLQASAAMNDVPGVFDAAEAMRARGFLDRLSLSAALSAEGVSPEARAKMLTLNDELESLARRRSAEIQKPESRQNKEGLLSIVNDVQAKEKEFADLDQSLMNNSRYKELRKPTLASLQDAQLLIKRNEAVLEYALWEKEGERQAWCLVIRKSGAELVKLDESFAFTEAVTGFREAILNNSEEREKIGEGLYEKLIAPVEGKLSGAEKIIIVPDGALAFLPFDALRKDSGSPYLAEGYELSLAPSVSVLRMVDGREYGSRENRWLAFGGALYSKEGMQAPRGRRELTVVKTLGDETDEDSAAQGARAYYEAKGYQWNDLPGTRSEVLTIERTVYGGEGTRVVLGEQASERLVKQLSESGELARQRVLHFACHGIFDPEYPAYSAVVLSEVSGELKDSSAEDGYLTVEDVALLRMKADMVELSACETGLGRVVQGDGVIGLTRAFMIAGAHSVGATLWVVDDLATKDFMVRVYGLVEKNGMNFAAAMAQAKREFIKSKDNSDPYYWSPFVLYGR